MKEKNSLYCWKKKIVSLTYLSNSTFSNMNIELLWSGSQVITVEPGCYFIDTLLTKARNDPISSNFFNWHEIKKYKSFGGVRIESDVVRIDNPF